MLTSATPTDALVEPPAGWVHEVQSQYGDARLAGTPSGELIVARPAYRAILRGDRIIATDVSTALVAWDPATDDVVFADAEGNVRRIHEGAITTIASGLGGVVALDVAIDGTVYAAHASEVTRVAADGTQSTIPSNDGPISAMEAEADGAVLIATSWRLHRVRNGVNTLIAGGDGPCAPPHPCGDEGPMAAAQFDLITDLEVGPDGSIYVAERRVALVRVIRPDGIVHDVAGSFRECVKVERFDCIPATGPRSPIQRVASITLSGESLFVADRDVAGHWQRLLQVTRAADAPHVAPQGYRMIASDGGVFTFGWSPFWGSTGDIRLVAPIVAGRSSGPDGYWFVAGDGGVFTFGDAEFFGSAAGSTTSPVVDMFASDRGDGYTILERNGTLHEYGSTVRAMQPVDPAPYAAIVWDGIGALRLIAERPSELPHLNVPIVAAHGTRSGNGTWYVASDGGVFTLGDAGFFGSTGAMRLNQPVLDLIPTPTEQGYWLIAADGGVFTFGDATFLGSMGGVRLNRPVVAGVAGPSPSG